MVTTMLNRFFLSLTTLCCAAATLAGQQVEWEHYNNVSDSLSQYVTAPFSVSPLNHIYLEAQRNTPPAYLNAILYSRDRGETWINTRELNDSMGSFTLSRVVFPDSRTIIIGGRGWNGYPDAWISQDGGQSWFGAPKGLTPISFVELKRTAAGDYLCTTTDGVYFSAQKLGAWEKVSDANAHGIECGPENTVYVGTNTDGLLRSDDGGRTWQRVSADYSTVQAFVLMESGTLVANFEEDLGEAAMGAFHRSTDKGASWEMIRKAYGLNLMWYTDSPLHRMAAMGDKILAVSGIIGPIYGTEDGTKWRQAIIGIDNDVRSRSVAFTPDGYGLIINLWGLFYRTTEQLAPPAVNTSAAAGPAVQASIRIAPHPVSDNVNLTIPYVPNAQELEVRIVSVTAKQVYRTRIQQTTAMETQLQIPCAHWPTGSYCYLIRAENASFGGLFQLRAAR